jgi:hypothetical protein
MSNVKKRSTRKRSPIAARRASAPNRPTKRSPKRQGDPVAAVVQPMSTQLMKADLPQQWANTINGHLKTSVESILAMGRDLIAAKKQVGHGPWLTMFPGRPDSVAKPLGFHESTARRLMIIVAHKELTNRAHVHVLPPSWGTLYELTKVPEPTLRKALTNGSIRPDMERREVASLRGRASQGKPRPGVPAGSTPMSRFSREAQEAIETLSVEEAESLIAEIEALLAILQKRLTRRKGSI